MGAVTLDLFSIAPLEEIAWVAFALGFDQSHVCGYTNIKCLRGEENKLEPGFAVNVPVNGCQLTFWAICQFSVNLHLGFN